MSHHPVSSPVKLRGGVRGTSGRALPAHLVARPRPQLDEGARQLLESLPRSQGSDVVSSQAMRSFAERALAHPSPAGVQALAYLGWSCREAARQKYPDDGGAEVAVAEALEKLSRGVAGSVEAAKRARRLIETAFSNAYAIGFAAGQEKLKEQLPDIVRETSFISDSAGKIVGKTEREFRPLGGKS